MEVVALQHPGEDEYKYSRFAGGPPSYHFVNRQIGKTYQSLRNPENFLQFCFD
jgi:hypothetical protein